jgi:nucleotide-binding universal stress UspA family protein
MPVYRVLREKALDLYRFVEKVVKNPGGLKIRRKIVFGDKLKKIVRVARDERIDLVVLGVGKESLARGKFLKMISRFHCPVLLNPALGKA